MATSGTNRQPARLTELAPGLTAAFVREALHRANPGITPIPPAAAAANKQLKEQKGDVDRAIHEVIENHVRFAGAQGFLTNLGGLTTMTYLVPANITGLALLQCRMVAGIAHLRGYDLANPRVRNAVLLTILGQESVKGLVKERKIPGTPMVVATAPAHDPDLDRIIAAEVTSAVVGRVIGKRAAGTVLRRVPLAGGVWGGSADAYATWQVGRYAARELRPRPVVAGTVLSGGRDQLRRRSSR